MDMVDGPARLPRVTRAFVVAVVVCLLAAACTSEQVADSAASPQDSPSSNPDTTAPVTSSTTTTQAPEPAFSVLDVDADFEGALLGVSTGLSRAERAPRFRQLEADAGRQFDIGHVFHAWDMAIPTDDDLMHLEDGRILMISWNGTDTIEIQNGVHDAWIQEQAEAVRDLETPLLLRWLWEMDGNRRIEWVHSPEDFVAAWRHIRGIFDDVGATNAQFVWCPNEFLFWDDGDPDPWYPGDADVDWLCADGYNWADSAVSPEWVTLDEIFGDFVEWAAPKNLPIMIGEVGSNEAVDDPSQKAAWLDAIPTVLRDELPEIDAFVYFDKDFTSFGHPDWRLDTSPESYDAWNRMANDPWMHTAAERES